MLQLIQFNLESLIISSKFYFLFIFILFNIFYFLFQFKKNCFSSPFPYSIIKKPMDFSTIEKKFNSDEYQNISEFISDVHLVFNNCKLYNRAETDVHIAALALEKAFDEKIARLTKKPEFLEKVLFFFPFEIIFFHKTNN
mgnify:CR=1 FL=1